MDNFGVSWLLIYCMQCIERLVPSTAQSKPRGGHLWLTRALLTLSVPKNVHCWFPWQVKPTRNVLFFFFLFLELGMLFLSVVHNHCHMWLYYLDPFLYIFIFIYMAVFLTIYIYIYIYIYYETDVMCASPDITLCGWLGSEHQLTNCCTVCGTRF